MKFKQRRRFGNMLGFWAKAKARLVGCVVKAFDAANLDASQAELMAGMQRLVWLMTAILIREAYVRGFRAAERQKAARLTA